LPNPLKAYPLSTVPTEATTLAIDLRAFMNRCVVPIPSRKASSSRLLCCRQCNGKFKYPREAKLHALIHLRSTSNPREQELCQRFDHFYDGCITRNGGGTFVCQLCFKAVGENSYAAKRHVLSMHLECCFRP